MAWVRLEDDFAIHPKIVGLSDGAFRLHVTSICYANRFLTDGRIPAAVISQLVRGHSRSLAKELVSARVWDTTRDGYLIHDYATYQPSRADVLTKRALRAQAGRMGGLANAQAKARALAIAEAQANELPRSRPRTQGSIEPVPQEDDTLGLRGVLKRMPR